MAERAARAADGANPVSAAFRENRSAWVHIGIFSAAVNLLMLTGSLYMLQVYDRVLASRSVATLVGISLIVLAAYLLQGWLDALRLRLLVRNAAAIDHRLFPLAARATLRLPLRGAGPAEALQPMRDLEALRGFLSGLGPTAFLDLPFLPLFLAGTFLLHPMLGLLATIGGLMVVGLTLFVERRGGRLAKQLGEAGALRHVQMEAGRRNAEVVSALGMEGHQLARLSATHARQSAGTIALSDTTGGIGSAAKVFRMILQSAILGLGAWLVILGELSPGAMIGASILIGRALAPIETAVAYWKPFIAARQGVSRLRLSLPALVDPPRSVALPPPRKRLDVTGLVVTAPGSTRPLVQGASFALEAGQSLGLIGPSGAGKSSLARAIAGVWPAAMGEIRLDGALAQQWDRDTLGKSVGYLPQDVEMFDGTIAENIARLEPDVDSKAVLRAAKAAGAHEMIIAMPHGYETRIGEGGAALSGGQRQRIALARALYRDPFLLVLDEPNSSLDAEGDEALTQALKAVRERGGIVVVVTHRPAGLAAVDNVAVLTGGRIRALGPRDEILKQVMPRRPELQAGRPRKAAS